MRKLIIGFVAAIAAAVSFTSFAEGDWTGAPDYYVEYVQATGQQYIDTGVNAASPLEADMVMMWDAIPTDGSFLAARLTGGSRLYVLHHYNNWTIGYGNYYNSPRNVSQAMTRKKYQIHTQLANGSQTMLIDGVTAFDNKAEDDYDLQKNLYLFCANNSGTAAYHVSAKCYALKIWQGGELRRDFLPCVKNDEACLYDTVSGEYFRNKTAKPLVAGPEANLTVDAIKPQVFSGYPLTPDVTVRFCGKVLEKGNDYEVSYANNTDFGVATVTVTGVNGYAGLKTQTSFMITLEYPFEVLNLQGASAGTYATFSEAFAAALNAGGGEIVLLGPATIDTRLAPAAADLSGKTVWIRSAEGQQYRLMAGTADAGFALPEVTSVFSLKFKDVILDGGAVWASDEVTSLSNGGLTRTASFIMLGGKNNYTYFDEGVVVENFHQGDAHYVIDSNAWSTRFYVDSADFIARRIRGGGFAHMGQNRQTHFRGTVTACYATAPALMLHDGANAGSAAYYDGTSICGNAVKSGSHAVRLHADWPANGLKLGSTDAASKICICDNFVAGAQTCANINPCKNKAVQVVGPLTADSSIGFSWPEVPSAATVPGSPFATVSYAGTDELNLKAFCYDFNPVEGVNYVGSQDGSNVAWADESQGGGGIEQDEVFRVLNPGEGAQTFDRLENAFAAVYSNAVIELTADALYDKEITIGSKQVVLRSAEGPRRVLKRVKGACITLQPTEVKDSTITIENLIVDGGAEWSDPDDLGNAACTGVKSADLFVTGFHSAGWMQDAYGILTLGGGATVRNVNAASAVLHPTSENVAGTIVMDEGSEIVDCRGECPVIAALGNGGQVRLNGGVITRCLGSVVVQRNGISQPAEIGAVTIVSNRVGTAALGQTSAGNNGYFKFIGGTTVVRDNLTNNSEENNANFLIRPHFSGSLEAGSDIRLGVSRGMDGNVTFDVNEGDMIGTLDAKGIRGGCYIHNLVNPKLIAAKAVVDGEDCFVWGKASGLMLIIW